jgi:hypothetical protein
LKIGAENDKCVSVHSVVQEKVTKGNVVWKSKSVGAG